MINGLSTALWVYEGRSISNDNQSVRPKFVSHSI